MKLFGGGKEIQEYEARGENARVYHEIKQVLRVTGVNLVFRKWAAFVDFLPMAWDAVRPYVETRAFENASDELRAEGVRAAAALGRLNARQRVVPGESQAWQIRAALAMYHYINPKLLVMISAIRLSLEGETIGEPSETHPELIERGIPGRMYPMEMVDPDTDIEPMKDVFKDIKKTLDLESVNSDYRTLALWPEYLKASWDAMKPIVQRAEYGRAVESLRQKSRKLARGLPLRIPLTRSRLESLGDEAKQAVESVADFEGIVPTVILNATLCALDWHDADALTASPFPAQTRRATVRVSGGGR